MFSISAAILGLTVIFLLFRRNKMAFAAGFFILFSLTYRIVDAAFVDVTGPVFAIELGRYVGGNAAAPMFVISCLAFVLPLWFVYRRTYLERALGPALPHLGYFANQRRAAFIACATFIAAVYAHMLWVGPIPLFVGMDRLEYKVIAGPLHEQLYDLSFILTSTLGIYTVLPRLQGGRFDARFGMLELAMLLYWMLTGNRFSIFYREISFFLIPFAAALAMEVTGRIKRTEARNAWSIFLSSRILVPLASIAAIAILAGLVVNSYYDVRNYSDPIFQMTQRSLVQPIQLWATAWADVDFGTQLTPDFKAISQVFGNGIDNQGNTSIQFLMSQELGYFRAAELINYGQQYAGGYPEIFFRLFGPWLAILFVFVYGTITALILRTSTVALTRGKPITALAAIYVFFGFSLAYIGGMLNFLLAYSFWVKILAFFVINRAEGSIIQKVQRDGRRALPDFGTGRHTSSFASA